MRATQRGVALLIVLWVMTILMATVLSFSLMTRAETRGTLTFRDRLEKKYLAEAGLERGIAEMINHGVNANRTVTLEGEELWQRDGTAYTGKLGNGGYVVRIFDESGKIPLNGLTDASAVILRNLLVNLGSSPQEADGICDAILDWKDADDLHRLSGAESDDYQSLKAPYRARNGNFESLEELLLVKGVTPAVLFGTETRKGLIQFVTLYNTTNRINLTVAPREVLEALPGVEAGAAEQLMEMRNSAAMKSPADVAKIIGGATSLAASHVTVQAAGTAICTITATGYGEAEKNGYSITATVELQSGRQYRYLYYKSPVESL